ncbi:MAG: S-adenosylmethionine synthetase N-terminal domain-containing protein [Anaerococcus hydrogenalis]|uniref:S-adenosylmethionine synthetase N-terminal domain-containing protein n=1 Tax=Anaerococcus hydrogenalis TaxID=33029 RepID=UPI0028FEE4E9|nr:S-adenosylmethionine synthetase N-terminal domain-containing protein [Anaerococcus hydrogenalis]MDU2583654.1 S-adenosylmethionine synthetase N-terminal domain-containing protein [Anaerococcus hydrogenalis]
MFEKVNPKHPDKIADCIAGAIVDLAYKEKENPKIAVEVLLGHGDCHVIIETDCTLNKKEIETAIRRIAGDVTADIKIVEQDIDLSNNQKEKIRCGDNGIFKGVPTSEEEKKLSTIASQSNVSTEILKSIYPRAIVNPLGDWTGGFNVDTGATNRKLGSDMGRAVTGGGLHGKDLSKADVSVNIYAHLKAREENREIELSCAIGDETVDGRPYSEIVEIARNYIKSIGGFEEFAKWGLI